MKMLKTLLAMICCVAMLFSTAVCMAETTEQATEIFSGFVSALDYVGENEEMIECSILIEALEGSFKADVAAEEIIVKVQEIVADEDRTEDFDPEAEYADVSEVTVVSNDGVVLEVSFVMPKGELNVDEFAIQGYVALADGVMLDADGNTVGKVAELTVWEMDENARANDSYVEHDYKYSYLTLKHDGGYIAEFYVSWKELVGYDHDGNMMFESMSWSENGDNKTAGYTTTITMKNAYDISITARHYTGLVWDLWQTTFTKSGLEFEEATLSISGTTLNSRASFRRN